MFTHAIHASGARASLPFISVNGRNMSAAKIEKVLFGNHDESANGTPGKFIGKFLAEKGGTLFLEEPSELSVEMQGKLLRFIETCEAEKGDARRAGKVDIHLISATSRNLLAEVGMNRFRADFFYKISIFPVIIPALRKRGEDIPALACAFLQRFCMQQGTGPLYLSADALVLLSRYHWPGNLRQLENVVCWAAVLSRNFELSKADFPLFCQENSETDSNVSATLWQND